MINNTFFNSVHITNFKSLKNVTLNDCKRINLLIGKPNVGKSNIIEAIGLFSLPYLKYNKNKKITQFVRLENLAELFFDSDVFDKITVEANGSYCIIYYDDEPGLFNVEILGLSYYIDVEQELMPSHKQNKNVLSKIKYYKFPHNFVFEKQTSFHPYLMPPVGVNLLDAIQISKTDKEVAKILSEYGLKLLFDKTNDTLRLMKELKGDNEMVSFPYNSIADTLQRTIFFKTAIASNKNSILLFEEPEAHCFPPYIASMTQDIIDSETNQFFIATHSPYVLTTCLERESSRKDLAIYIADFKDGQTVINRLTDAELEEVYEYGLDLFFNHELFA